MARFETPIETPMSADQVVDRARDRVGAPPAPPSESDRVLLRADPNKQSFFSSPPPAQKDDWIDSAALSIAIGLKDSFEKPSKQFAPPKKKQSVVVAPVDPSIVRNAARMEIYKREHLDAQRRRGEMIERCLGVGPGTRDELRKRVFARYGNECACCHEKVQGFLTVDHVGGGGSRHRRAAGNYYYQDILTDPNPQRYRLLCMNCNWATRGGRGCPHQA